MTTHEPAVADQDRFTAETERYRRELLAHCYRIVGSAQEAEDLVQETYLRAWRSYAGFKGRASIRTWLYKIATNVCLTALEPRRIRVLPSGLAGPYDGPDRQPSQFAPGEVSWLGPLPDRWIVAADNDPAAIVVARESLRLALIASLQHLPARQRAILILREVLAFSAAETAQILGTTTAAVKSGLQRARARLDELEPEPEELLEPTDERARALLDAYIAAFECSDAGMLERVLRTDATLEAAPFREWQAGRAKCIHMLDAYVLDAPGDWQMIASRRRPDNVSAHTLPSSSTRDMCPASPTGVPQAGRLGQVVSIGPGQPRRGEPRGKQGRGSGGIAGGRVLPRPAVPHRDAHTPILDVDVVDRGSAAHQPPAGRMRVQAVPWIAANAIAADGHRVG